MNNDDFRQKTLVAFASMTNLLWGINQIIINEFDLDIENQKLANALRDAQEDMLDAVRALGIDVKTFENYKIKTDTKKNKDN